MARKHNVEINVTGPVERALRQLKKKVEREGVIRDLKRLSYFEPPTQKRRKRLIRAIKKNLMNRAAKGLI